MLNTHSGPQRLRSIALFFLVMAAMLTAFALVRAPQAQAQMVLAQQALPGAQNQGRRCHTIRTCRFQRGGLFRGCISSYSCRRCRIVRSRCTINGVRRTCQRVRCGLGV
ncbi:MAG: hypothetical protein AAFR04_01035 [Pseudomonadota bacterium]